MEQTKKDNSFTPVYTPGPAVFVYKTKAGYENLVPVLLSADKTTIVSYPHPSDLKKGDGYLTPTKLKNGYLLDNKGINSDVAFLKMTYDEYAALASAPDLNELNKLIIDKDPLTELCNCGNRKAFSDVIVQLNQMIEDKSLKKKCKIEK
jgi:hypothetical protein